jgi:D-alanyl-D-alanine carboxypeptidase
MSSRPRSRLAIAVLVLGAALLGVLLQQSLSSPSSSASAPFGVEPPPLPPRPDQRLGLEDGLLPDDVTVFDDEYPGVARLDADLLGALRRAAAAAAHEGVDIVVNSGWRSAEYQEHLLEEAIAEHGSREEAARWVSSPSTSLHVSGDAVDVGPEEATAWLSEHGSEYGLCRTYRNEPWHYELRPDAADAGCPQPYADPRHDPRMQP